MSANLGKISLTIGGNHVISNTYERLTIVKNSTDVWYLSLWDVPANIPLTDQGYWVVFFDPAMNSQQVADNAQSIVALQTSMADAYTSKKPNTFIRLGSAVTKNYDGISYDDKTNTFTFTSDQPLDSATPVLSLKKGGRPKSNGTGIVLESDVSEASTVSKIVRRNSSGDVFARLFRPSNSSEANNSTFVVVQHARGTSDNYMRTRSLGNFASDVGAEMYTFRSGWINLTKYNGWTGTCRYRKTNDETVLLEAVVKNTSGSTDYSLRHIATLPAGYRPETTIYNVCRTNRSGYHVGVEIRNDGKIYSRTIGAYYTYLCMNFKRSR